MFIIVNWSVPRQLGFVLAKHGYSHKETDRLWLEHRQSAACEDVIRAWNEAFDCKEGEDLPDWMIPPTWIVIP